MHPRWLATQLFLVIGDSCNIIVVIKQVLLVWRKWNINRIVSETAFCTIIMVHNGTSSSYRLCLRSSWCYMYIYFFTRHLLVRAKGEVLVLLCVFFCSLFCQQFLDNSLADSSEILHAGVLWFPMCFLPFWG